MTIMTQTETASNGVNSKALIGARGAFAEMPEAASFIFRTNCDWTYGAKSQNNINGYFGAGEEHTRKKTFTIGSDHPEVFAASDTAPTPPEIVLSALASCLIGGIAAVAQHRGIQLRKVQARVEGDMDMRGILGVYPEIRNGFSAVRVKFEIDADASDEDIRALLAQSQKRSAVFDLLTNPTNVNVTVS